jgi:chorismate dehydratase
VSAQLATIAWTSGERGECQQAWHSGEEKRTMSGSSPLRIGAVNYLNTKPLIYRLAERAQDLRLELDLPSRLADRLAAGALDVALIPVFELLQQPGYTIVSDACIACRGPVWSVKLFCRVPPAQIKTLALDEGSRTSAALVRVLLKQRFGLAPKLEPLPIGDSLGQTEADAVLLIGDRAMRSPGGPFVEVWDLGDEWCRSMELPFVFAVWAARAGVDVTRVERVLGETRDRGLAHLREIAAAEAAPLGLTQPECYTYFDKNLHFTLGPREQAGLETFAKAGIECGLLPEQALEALASATLQ